jgi:hypothetical protein
MYLAKYCCGKFHNIVLKTEDLKSFVVNMKYQSIKAPQARALAATNAGMILHMFTARYIASSNQRGDTPEELVAIKDMKNQMEILAALVLSIGDNHAYSPAEILLIDTILKYADIEHTGEIIDSIMGAANNLCAETEALRSLKNPHPEKDLVRLYVLEVN